MIRSLLCCFGKTHIKFFISITSINTSVIYIKIQIIFVDTPGHADFGGEVELILNLVDVVLCNS